jgi:hypothetical protein
MENSLAGTLPEERSTHWRAAGAGLVLLLLLALAGWMITSQVVGNMAQERRVKAIAAFEEETGIRVVRLVRTAGGGIMDLQYQVVDPDKALIVHDADQPPMMLDEKSNLVFANPFHDHAARELHTAVTYHELIMNGGGLLERGSKVTLKIGDSILEHLVVQ